jgi:S1-C subfamily serine protease
MKVKTGRGRWFSIAALLVVMTLTLSGCGLFGGDDARERSQQTQQTEPSNNGNAGATDTANTGQSNGAGSTTQAQPTPQAQMTEVAVAGQPAAAPQGSTAGQAATGQQAPAPAPLGDFTSAIRNVAQQVKPAVVQITNEQVQADQFGQATVPAGVGSGVIYDEQGHIITNNHVIEGAERLVVSLPDGRSFPAQLLGADPRTDLAVIQIQGDNLPVAQLGDSRQLQVGDWVVAIGNALGLPGGPTVTAGVVSALGRTVQEPGSDGAPGPFLFDVIQTSAPINPGNSGGALVNLAGQVIGINTLVAGQAAPGVSAQGIGFAVSIQTAKPIADQLVANGRAIHPSIGIGYAPLNPAIAAQLGVDQPYGAVVLSVANGSPAEQAGLQRGDVIVTADGMEIKEDSALPQVINQHRPGDQLLLEVLRDGNRQAVTVTLGEAE